MAGLRDRRLLIAWIAILGLISNLAAAALCCVPAKSAAEKQLSILGEFALCLHDGVQAAAQLDDSEPTQPAAKSCPLCLATATAALVLVAGVILGLIVISAGARFSFDFIAIAHEELRRAGLGSRAPPLPA
jgi:hypothetical protein